MTMAKIGRIIGRVIGLIWLGLLAPLSPIAAQTLNFASADRDKPIEIFADDGIEWRQDNELLIARGNAKAVRSNVSITGDILRAYYSKKKTGGTDLSRLDAVGKVTIQSPTEKIIGQAAVYDMQQGILVVQGKKVVFTSGPDIITANQQMEYYERAGKAVARGNAIVNHDGKTVRADILVAYFHKNKQGKSEVYKIDAHNNVVIVTEQDTVRAGRGVYNINAGLVTLMDNVRITRGQNQLSGDRAEININTGISKLLTAPSAQSTSRSGAKIRPTEKKKKKRVRGLLMPHRPDPGKKR
jgi:lipopolysaccharide export system protein LptA